ncbi:isoamylase early set domain-containing protein [Thermodesulfobacteriota bacterium]
MPRKNYLKNGNKCRVTFELPPVIHAKKASLCGEFNDWNPKITPMVKRKDGRWSVTISLEAGREYRYRYLLDGKNWENDWNADKYEKNSYGTEDSIIRI